VIALECAAGMLGIEDERVRGRKLEEMQVGSWSTSRNACLTSSVPEGENCDIV